MEDTLLKANEEILIAAYSLSESSFDLIEVLRTALQKGVRVIMVINRFEEQPSTIRKKLQELNEAFEYMIINNFSPEDKREDLHAKIVVADYSKALIGSANITWKGLVSNHEIMLSIAGPSAWKMGKLIVDLSRNPNSRVVPK
jgi:cardiolipin synthase